MFLDNHLVGIRAKCLQKYTKKNTSLIPGADGRVSLSPNHIKSDQIMGKNRSSERELNLMSLGKTR